jgi:hypothetical protein
MRIDAVHGEPVCAVVESMTGARLVQVTLEQEGWSVEIADDDELVDVLMLLGQHADVELPPTES